MSIVFYVSLFFLFYFNVLFFFYFIFCLFFFFFFSSRRRHTRWTGDWSSDVCSSDLELRRLKTESVASRVTVRLSAERRLTVVRRERDAGWVETLEAIPWAITRLRVTGTIESSLYDALDKAMPDSFLPAGERRQLAWAIADVYDWEVDFSRDIRPGDRFTVLLERLESAEGERRFGRILAARVDVAGTPQYAFYFEG